LSRPVPDLFPVVLGAPLFPFAIFFTSNPQYFRFTNQPYINIKYIYLSVIFTYKSYFPF